MPPPRINYWTGFASIEKVFILWVIPAVQRLVETQLTFHSGDSYTDSGFTVKGRLPSSDWPLGNPWGWLLSRLSDYMARLSHSKIQRQCIRDLHFAEAGSTVDHAILPHGNSFTEQIGENFMPKWGHHYRNNSLLIISGDSGNGSQTRELSNRGKHSHKGQKYTLRGILPTASSWPSLASTTSLSLLRTLWPTNTNTKSSKTSSQSTAA